MPDCAVEAVLWKSRPAYRLSNGVVDFTVLLGGGQIADLRLRGSAINAVWEAPWQTIDPQSFSSREHAALYGDGPAGKFLSGYTGHALALGYFGMPSAPEASQGLALHGEAGSSAWHVVSADGDAQCATLVLGVELPSCQLHFERHISLAAGGFSVSITERITNRCPDNVDFQWVEHASFGEPFLANAEASLFVSGAKGVTWPLGYEGHRLLPKDAEFQWPHVRSVDGEVVDLSEPFIHEGTGFVAALLTDAKRKDAFAVVHNRRHALITGFSFDRDRFPWITLWEENRARQYAPWNGKTRVRGVEFGNSPMPLGLDQARAAGTLLGTPVLTTVGGGQGIATEYQLFLSAVPTHWTQIKDVRQSEKALIVSGDGNEKIRLDCRKMLQSP